MATAVEPFYAAFGALVREHRSGRGLTQAVLGARLVPPVTRASVANLEAGKQRVLLDTALQLASLLEVPITDLLPPRGPAGPWEALVDELTAKLDLSPKQVERLLTQVGAP